MCAMLVKPSDHPEGVRTKNPLLSWKMLIIVHKTILPTSHTCFCRHSIENFGKAD